jgi:hypothetical protein|uniref:Protein argonaute n=1 Tax=Roseihalotalea indica TaxID=2867963 RepID=A0AA49GJJ2_9BACT|nr:hypothetical protein K4G66_26930 [Tunicatimonas sp. TK19036]
MEIKLLDEPILEFGNGESICPREGVENFSPYDITSVRPEKIITGIIGKSSSIEILINWLEKAKTTIIGKESKLDKLFRSFNGFNQESSFKSQIVYDDSYLRKINNSDFESLLKKCTEKSVLIAEVAKLFLAEVKFLSKNKNPDLIICVLPEDLVKTLLSVDLKKEESEEEIEDSEVETKLSSLLEHDLRRLMKAEAMEYNIPIQIIRDRIKKPTSDMQDEATIAWNLFTALYYKASGTPWAMKKPNKSIVCYAGISFYRSRDRKTIQTSCTQIFNEHGKGVILRGAPVELKKGDREPHLKEDQAYELLNNSLREYYDALKIYPQRLVLHKSSNFNEAEIEGFKAAAYKNNISALDLVTIMPTPLRLYSTNNYPPYRGTWASFDNNTHLLYTKGFVPFYNTYPGMYIPNPIEVRLFSHDESPQIICQEILSLTKMNWNNTQFDRKFPITIECSKKVGEILKYLDENQKPQLKYSFYM